MFGKLVPVPSGAVIPERDIGKRPILNCINLGVTFGGLKAVDDFNLMIGRTEIAGLIGPNGAGKTTVFNLLTKVYQPTRGTILLNGKDTHGMSIAQAVENVNRLKEKGKIRSIGVSNFTLEMLQEARQYGQIDVVQPCYNLLWRYIDRDLLPYCTEEGIGVIPYSTLAQGLLTGKFKPDTPITGGRSRAALFQPGVYEKCLKVADFLVEVGKQYGVTATQVCINWLVNNKNLTAPIVGGTDKRHAEQNIQALNFTLSQEDYDRIDAYSREFCSQMPEYVLFFNTEVKGE